MPTSPLLLAGDTIDPSVSVPTAAPPRLAAIAAPEPELDPDGFLSSAYGFFVCPPRPLHPLDECVERKFAHSLRFVLPRITAPAGRTGCVPPHRHAWLKTGEGAYLEFEPRRRAGLPVRRRR